MEMHCRAGNGAQLVWDSTGSQNEIICGQAGLRVKAAMFVERAVSFGCLWSLFPEEDVDAHLFYLNTIISFYSVVIVWIQLEVGEEWERQR